MRKLLLLLVVTIIFFSCQNKNVILDEERLGFSRSNWEILIPNPVPPVWTFGVFYRKFVKDEFNTNSDYQNLVAFDMYTESMFTSLGSNWFESTPLLKLFAYQVFCANGNEPIPMGFDTSLRLDEKEGGVYHTQWGIFFLKAGVGPNYVSRSVFNHELVHAFQDKVCNYTMNINTRPLVEFEADIATDALEFVCNKGSFPNDYEPFLLSS